MQTDRKKNQILSEAIKNNEIQPDLTKIHQEGKNRQNQTELNEKIDLIWLKEHESDRNWTKITNTNLMQPWLKNS